MMVTMYVIAHGKNNRLLEACLMSLDGYQGKEQSR